MRKALVILLAGFGLALSRPALAVDDAPPASAGEAERGPAARGEGAKEAKPDIGDVMLEHVADSYVIEAPGVCGGGLSWECRLDLHRAFGDSLRFGSVDLTPTRQVVMMWLAALLLVVVALTAARRRSLVPHGLYNFVETLVAFVRSEIAIPNMGAEHADRYVPYLVTAFFFILFMNLLGLLPWASTATANLSVTAIMATFTFVITQGAAIRSMGLGGYLSHLTGGVDKKLWPLWFVMVPVEIMGLFTKPFALTVRLFANMVAGHFVILALLGLIYIISPWVGFGSVPMAIGVFLLEIFVALVQSYIFTMLSALFIGAGLQSHGHGHEAHAHAGPGAGAEHEAHGSHAVGSVPGRG